MLSNFFEKSNPISGLLITALFFILYSVSLFSEKTTFTWLAVPLFLGMLGIINFINAKNNLTSDNAFLFLLFVLLFGFFPKTISTTGYFYVNLTSLLFFRKIYSLRLPTNVFKKLFDAGFWLGISLLIEPFSVLFLPLLYVSMYTHHKFNSRNFFISLLGLITPVFLFFTYCFWFDKLIYFETIFINFYDCNIELHSNTELLFSYLFIGILLFISIVFKTVYAFAINNSFRKNWIIVLLHFFLALLLVLLIKCKNDTDILFILFPSAIIIANGIELIKNKIISDILIAILIICSITICAV